MENLDRLQAILHALGVFFVKALAATLLVVFGPLRDVYLALAVLMIIDLITGTLRARKTRTLSSSRARQMTVVKFVVYWSVVAASYQVGVILGKEYVVEVSVAYLAVNEFISISENARVLMGRDILPPQLIDWMKRRRDGDRG